MQRAIDETNRRRTVQEAYNSKHDITPQGIKKAIAASMQSELDSESKEAKALKKDVSKIPTEEYPSIIKDLSAQMDMAAKNLEFEKAADLRDLINEIKKKM